MAVKSDVARLKMFCYLLKLHVWADRYVYPNSLLDAPSKDFGYTGQSKWEA